MEPATQSKPYISILLLIIVSFVLGGAVVHYWFPRTSEKVFSTTTSERPNFFDLVKQGGTYRCLLSAKIRSNELTPIIAYTHNGSVSGQYSFVTDPVAVSFVVQNNITYIWNNRDDFGTTYDNTGNTSTGTPDLSKSPALQKISDYACEPWTFDQTKFDVPTSTIRFSPEIY